MSNLRNGAPFFRFQISHPARVTPPLERIVSLTLLDRDPLQFGHLFHRPLTAFAAMPESFTPPNGMCGSS